MAENTSLATIDIEATEDVEDGSVFGADWKTTDTANLLPANLALPRATRAWERKPHSPFARRKLRVGKIWKRAVGAPLAVRAAANAPPTHDNRVKRLGTGSVFRSPLKPVKKLRVTSEYGTAAQVLQWERRDSPTKRIVTRSGATEDLVGWLQNAEDGAGLSQDDVNATFEIFDENGEMLDVDATTAEAEEGWSDVETKEGPVHDTPSSKTTTHLKETMEHPQSAGAVPRTTEEKNVQTPEILAPPIHRAVGDSLDSEPAPSTVSREITVGYYPPSVEDAEPLHAARIPAGFVSPIKRNRLVSSIPQNVTTGRRKTLPAAFAPASSSDEVQHKTPSQSKGEAVEENTAKSIVNMELIEDDPADGRDIPGRTDTAEDFKDTKEAPADSEWEDASHEQCDSGSQQAELLQPCVRAEATELNAQIEAREGSSEGHAIPPSHIALKPNAPKSQSPQHPSLPLRRSPRRKSSSPRKRKVVGSVQLPHLVPFSPIKFPDPYPAPHIKSGTQIQGQIGTDTTLVRSDVPEQPSPPERSASAPPEEPRMSPRKPSKPRVSDDTALLQAFLNRAAESKSSRRVSAHKRESLVNRRDSDAVRHALASPAKTDVLVDLDPNSPSPRKPLAMLDIAQEAHHFATMADGTASEAILYEQEAPRARRSGRERRKVERLLPLAPNVISVRGNAAPVVLKGRSDAQELAVITRNNTRKNKGGSVIPTLRLLKLASESTPEDSATENTDVRVADGKRRVNWDETLAYYFARPSEPGDSGSEPQLQIHPMLQAEADDAALPPAAETPSKPRVRRLKAPRTAATPAKVAKTGSGAAQEEAAAASAQQQETKLAPAATKRTRIATPAKGVGNTSLLPPDLAPTAPGPQPPAPKKATPRKKLTSKLPAPKTAVGQGKENQSLLASPPKKAGGLPAGKTFAPKLALAKSRPDAPTQADEATMLPGLASPAKKGRRGVGLGNGGVAVDEGSGLREELAGLRSPAKKRTKRGL